MNDDEKYILNWLNIANKDAQFIYSICEDPVNLTFFKTQILFYCQQSIEKYFKALLLYHRINFPKIHQLEKLKELFNKNGHYFVDGFDFKNLSSYAVDSRYPDEYEEPTIDEMNYYIQLVSEIKYLVESKIKFQAP